MAKKTIKAQMKQRRDTKANWAATNPVLLDGELGIVSDDPNLYKVGDGATAWNSLPFRGFDGTLAQELGTSANAVISQKVLTEKLTEFSSQPILNVATSIGTYDGGGSAATNDKAIRSGLIQLPPGKYYASADADQTASSFKIMRKNSDGSYNSESIGSTAACIDTSLDDRPFLLVFYFSAAAKSDYFIKIRKAERVKIEDTSEAALLGTMYIVANGQTSNNVIVADSDSSKAVLYENTSNKILSRVDIPKDCRGIMYETPEDSSVAIFFYYASGNPCARFGFYTGSGVVSVPTGCTFFRAIISSSATAGDYSLFFLNEKNEEKQETNRSSSLPAEIGTRDAVGNTATNDKALRSLLVDLPAGTYLANAEADQPATSFKIMRKNSDGSFDNQTYEGACAYINNTTDTRPFYIVFYFEANAQKTYAIKIKKIEEKTESAFTLRAAFWNIGKLSMGTQPSSAITSANAETIKREYRKAFDSTAAHIIGFAEFSSIFNTDTQTTADKEILSNYPHHTIGPEYEYNMNAIFSAYPPICTANRNFTKRTQTRYAKEATFIISGRPVIYVATHLDWDNKEYLEAQIGELVNWYKDEKHVIIGGDFNTGETVGGPDAFDKFIGAGYTMLNHDYLGDIPTYPTGRNESVPTSTIDNIVCKGATVVNRQSKTNEGLSDHCLIFCDLIF